MLIMKRQVMLPAIVWQVCIVVGLGVCIALKPAGLAANDGVSYYGTFGATFAPFALAILGPAVCALLIARQTTKPDLWPLRFSLIFFALLAAIITFTPYTVSTFMDWTHTIAGSLLFALQLALSFWLAAKLHWEVWTLLLACLELTAGIVCAVYVLPAHGFLIQAQIVFQLAFGGLLIYALNKLHATNSVK